MKIRIYHELNGTVRITKVVEQGPEKGKESSMFHNLKPGRMAEVEIDAVLQHQACVKESKSESKEKDDSCNLQKFLQVLETKASVSSLNTMLKIDGIKGNALDKITSQSISDLLD